MSKHLLGAMAVLLWCVSASQAVQAADKPAVAEKGHIAQSAEDKEIVAKQGPTYPLKTCVVTGEAFEADEAINYVYRGRLVKFCCKGCIRTFEAKPEGYLAKLDKAATEQAAEKPKADAGR